MKYCSRCGGVIRPSIPPGDSRERFVCTQCGEVFYENPRMIVGSIPEWDGRLLLCRRAIEPRLGLWTLPAGFLENGETTTEGAARESEEEVGAPVAIGSPLILVNLPRIHQIHLFYLGRLVELPRHPGRETLETGLFAETDLPWNDLAFPSVRLALEYYFQKRREGRGFPFHIHDLRIERTLQPVAK
jgi:ADP-ribose pyrophosphatase YjhB (NUDIX family)